MNAQLQIRLPLDLKDRAEKLAKRSLVSLSDIARIALKEKVERDEQEAKAQPSTTEVGS